MGRDIDRERQYIMDTARSIERSAGPRDAEDFYRKEMDRLYNGQSRSNWIVNTDYRATTDETSMVQFYSDGTATTAITKKDNRSQELSEAKQTIEEMKKILETIQKEPLILQTINRMSKDKKHAYIKKGDQDIRIETVKDLEAGDEVLLHPKTFQIVERIGKPPLVLSRFAPDTIPNVKWNDIG